MFYQIKNKKNLPITLKVTLWYTTFIAIIIFTFLIFAFYATKGIIEVSSQNELIKKVEEMSEDYPEDFENFDDGIYFSVYKNNNIVKGVIPKKTPENIKTSIDKVSEVKKHKEKILYYDKKINDTTFIRGILPISKAIENTKMLTITLFLISPFLILLIAFGGFRLMKKAFRPISNLSLTAEEIRNTGDFSKRLYTGQTKDEIYNMATVLNSMLDSLENNYLKEKQFSNDVSHELRTPLSVILNESEYGIEYSTDKESVESFNIIKKQSLNMKKIIESLLELSRVDNKYLNKENTNISNLTKSIIEDRKNLLKEKNIKINYSINPDITILTNQVLFTRLVDNLLSNAIKFTKDTVTVNLYRKENNIILDIIDNGIGISPENINRIWQRFYQVDESRNKYSNQGVGLGLSLVKDIIKTNQWKIDVKSELNKGSCFRIYIK